MLILSSDGLFRVLSEETLAAKTHEMRQKAAQGLGPAGLSEMTREIIEEVCQNYYCKDNVSLVMVDLAKHYADYKDSKEKYDLRDLSLN